MQARLKTEVGEVGSHPANLNNHEMVHLVNDPTHDENRNTLRNKGDSGL